MIKLDNLLKGPFSKIFLSVALITSLAPYPFGVLFDYMDNRREYNDLVSLTEQARQKAQGEGDFSPEEQLKFLSDIGYRDLVLMDENKRLELWLGSKIGSDFKAPIGRPLGIFFEGIELADFGVSKGTINMGPERLLYQGRRTLPQAYVSMGENSVTFVDRIELSKEDLENYLAKN